jgi:hypothetical protein
MVPVVLERQLFQKRRPAALAVTHRLHRAAVGFDNVLRDGQFQAKPPLSSVLAMAGLSAVVVDDMRLRMIGVVGYAAILPVVALLLGVLFVRTEAST